MRRQLRLFGAVLAVLGLSIIALRTIYEPWLVAVLSSWISSDHQLTADGLAQLRSALYFAGAIVCIASVLLLAGHRLNRAGDYIRIFLSDVVHPLPTWGQPAAVLIVATVAGLLQMLNIRYIAPATPYFESMFAEDGIFETMTPVLMVAAIILLGVAIVRGRRDNHALPRWLVVLWLILMAGFLFDAGEEVSWGQRIFHWSTPQTLSQVNVQNETNLHNIFNGYFDFGYRVLYVLPALTLASVALHATRSMRPTWALALPHPSLIGLTLVIAFVLAVSPSEEELLEELVSVVALCYAFRIALVAPRFAPRTQSVLQLHLHGDVAQPVSGHLG
jgi:hypothetical protein